MTNQFRLNPEVVAAASRMTAALRRDVENLAQHLTAPSQPVAAEPAPARGADPTGPQEQTGDRLAQRRTPRPFVLLRRTDVTGVSGTGVVAEGVEFADGSVALRWLSEWPTSVVFHDRGIASVEHVHGHGGATEVVWLDDPQTDAHGERGPLRTVKDQRGRLWFELTTDGYFARADSREDAKKKTLRYGADWLVQEKNLDGPLTDVTDVAEPSDPRPGEPGPNTGNPNCTCEEADEHCNPGDVDDQGLCSHCTMRCTPKTDTPAASVGLEQLRAELNAAAAAGGLDQQNVDQALAAAAAALQGLTNELAAERDRANKAEALVKHYRHRADMTPSTRQSLLGETPEQARQPEAGWIELATRHVADNLIDSGAYGWWIEQAQQRGLDSGPVLEIAQALAASLREQGRPFDVRTLAEVRAETERGEIQAKHDAFKFRAANTVVTERERADKAEAEAKRLRSGVVAVPDLAFNLAAEMAYAHYCAGQRREGKALDAYRARLSELRAGVEEAPAAGINDYDRGFTDGAAHERGRHRLFGCPDESADGAEEAR